MYKAAVTESGLTMWVEGGDFRFNLVIQHPYEVSYMTQEHILLITLLLLIFIQKFVDF